MVIFNSVNKVEQVINLIEAIIPFIEHLQKFLYSCFRSHKWNGTFYK